MGPLRPLNEFPVADAFVIKNDISVLTYQEALDVFLSYRNMDLNWSAPEYGCQARAEVFSYEIEKKKHLKLAKAMISTDRPLQEYFYAPLKMNKQTCFKWSFHVAPVVMVRTQSGKVPFVIDPTLFDEPRPVEDWKRVVIAERTDAALSIKIVPGYELLPTMPEKRTEWVESDILGAKNFLKSQRLASANDEHLREAISNCPSQNVQY